MTVGEAMARLEALGDPKVRKQNCRAGAGDSQFGVRLGDIRKLAKEIKADPGLAADLWETGCGDARLLSVLICAPARLKADRVEAMVLDSTYGQLADWVNSYVVKLHPAKEELRIKWMAPGVPPPAARAGWSLTTERVVKNPEGLDLSSLLDRIEGEMANAHELPKWTMNFCLAEIGIRHPELRSRALEIGEKLGVYRDFPTPKGCTSPFAPLWIAEMVRRDA